MRRLGVWDGGKTVVSLSSTGSIISSIVFENKGGFRHERQSKGSKETRESGEDGRWKKERN